MSHQNASSIEIEPTLRNVFQILGDWGAEPDEVCRIVGITQDDLVEWKANPPETLESDLIERLVLIESIAQYLEGLVPSNPAQWPKLNNQAELFGGTTPLSVMASGRLADLRRVNDWIAGWAY